MPFGIWLAIVVLRAATVTCGLNGDEKIVGYGASVYDVKSSFDYDDAEPFPLPPPAWGATTTEAGFLLTFLKT